MLLSACAGDPEGPAIVYDACAATAVALGPDTTAAERAGVTAALALWRAAGGPAMSLVDDAPGAGQVLAIGFEPAAPVFFGIYRADRGDILINRGLGAHAREITIAHEIGHAFGLAHVNGRRSLMSPGNLDVPPSADDVLRLHAVRSACPDPPTSR